MRDTTLALFSKLQKVVSAFVGASTTSLNIFSGYFFFDSFMCIHF